MKKYILCAFAMLYFCAVANAQNINKIEYFVDADPGFGAGTDVPITIATPVTANFNVALLNTVADGFHFLSVRARDVSNNWSVVAVRPFYKEIISTASIPNITAMEYFIDADPGYGLATSVGFAAGSPLTQNFTVALPNTVADGFHFLSLRAKDVNNNWSIVAVRPFYKENISTAPIPNITAMEYFLDADPGYGSATSVTVTASSPLTQNFTVALPNTVTDGFHFLSVRAKDANNKWSVVAVRPFYKETISNATIPNITAMEYFLDADPGFGAATALTVTAGSPISQNFTVALPNTVTDGFHFLSVRAKDANNKWSVVAVRPFFKETVPSAIIPNIVLMEYFIDADPGFGLATNVPLTAGTPISQALTVNLGTLANGNHKLSIRVKDVNNRWGIVGIRDFVVQSNIVIISNVPTQWCKLTNFNIPFAISGTFTGANVFTAQLSDINGSFTSPTNIGTLTSTSAGTIVANVPNTASLSNNYQIRVISSVPAITNSPTKPFQLVSVCPPPCAGLLTLVNPTDNYSSGIITKEANALTGEITATNLVTGTANVIYRAGKSIMLNAGFKADNGVVFKTEFGGCN